MQHSIKTQQDILRQGKIQNTVTITTNFTFWPRMIPISYSTTDVSYWCRSMWIAKAKWTHKASYKNN